MREMGTVNMKNQKNLEKAERTLAVTLAGLYLLSMLILGAYNFPSADDYSMSLQAHLAYESGGFFAAVGAALAKTVRFYLTWTGYYSSAFLTIAQPFIYGEKLYALGVFIVLGTVTVSVYYFTDRLINGFLKAGRGLGVCIGSLLLLLIVHGMPAGEARVEGFYWYSGAVNYTVMCGLSFLFLGLMISAVTRGGRSGRTAIVLATILGTVLGGANYLTGLCLAIVCALVIVAATAAKRTASIAIPAAVFELGFIASCLAPGNRVRGSESEGYGAVKSVLLSLYYTLNLAFDEWVRWDIICILLIAGVLFAVIARRTSFRYPKPFLVLVFCYGLSSATITPILFVSGAAAAGRIQAVFWIHFISLLLFAEGYLIGWITKHLMKAEAAETTSAAGKALAALTVILMFGSVLCLIPNPGYYTGTEALREITSKEARQYREEMKGRLELLHSEEVQITMAPLSVQPELLFFSEVSDDPGDWINQAMTEYYHKDSIRVSR